MRRPKRTILIAGVALTLAVGGTLAANATWSIPGRSAPIQLKTAEMPRGPKPDIAKQGGSAVVTWPAQEIVPGVAMRGYVVTRYDADHDSSFEAFPAVAGTTLTDADVPAGKFYWTVTPKFAAWTGEESKKSENVKFSAPAGAARAAVVATPSATGPAAPTTAATQTAGGGDETADPPPAPAVTTAAPAETTPAPVTTTTPLPAETSAPAGDANPPKGGGKK
ncbi:hypothetical protein ACFQFC_27860 [Amorphoplanes digitatis]|uniref:Fibronectin type-III domain-containing protein n=1 Tax=Actinoplanes digitatis TaxID=1868 RepID=A0A7W7HSF2_9ACTN|nr:hypothetical protein [Actinoplanes digitatis]MBB4759961.1 hypothetical protein [Actinoplanes digitatis]GID96509.1 hypothetical protein Adi01nite_59210 [Actinoplanes digitatis]